MTITCVYLTINSSKGDVGSMRHFTSSSDKIRFGFLTISTPRCKKHYQSFIMSSKCGVDVFRCEHFHSRVPNGHISIVRCIRNIGRRRWSKRDFYSLTSTFLTTENIKFARFFRLLFRNGLCLAWRRRFCLLRHVFNKIGSLKLPFGVKTWTIK